VKDEAAFVFDNHNYANLPDHHCWSNVYRTHGRLCRMWRHSLNQGY